MGDSMLTLILILILIGSIKLSWWAFKGLAKLTWFFLCLIGYIIIGVLAIGVLSIAFAGPLLGIAILISLGGALLKK